MCIRDSIDAVRAGSLLIVVLGHWLMATVVVQGDQIIGANALTSIPALQLARWLRQVMPLFFIAGGFSNITVWRSLPRRGGTYPEYLKGGDLFAIVYDAKSGKLHVLNASGRSAYTATPD